MRNSDSKSICWPLLFHIFCSMVSIAVIGISSMVLYSAQDNGDKFYRGYIFSSADACVMLIIFGICSYAVALIGCWNAVIESKYMQNAYAVLLLIKLIFGNFLLYRYIMIINDPAKAVPLSIHSWMSLETFMNTILPVAIAVGIIEAYLLFITPKTPEPSVVITRECDSDENISSLPSYWNGNLKEHLLSPKTFST